MNCGCVDARTPKKEVAAVTKAGFTLPVPTATCGCATDDAMKELGTPAVTAVSKPGFTVPVPTANCGCAADGAMKELGTPACTAVTKDGFTWPVVPAEGVNCGGTCPGPDTIPNAELACVNWD